MPAILVVDDEANIRRMLRGLLEAEGYRVTEAEDGGAGVERAVTEDPDVVLMGHAADGRPVRASPAGRSTGCR